MASSNQEECYECHELLDPDEQHEHPLYTDQVICQWCLEDGVEEPSLDWMIDEDEDEYWDHEN